MNCIPSPSFKLEFVTILIESWRGALAIGTGECSAQRRARHLSKGHGPLRTRDQRNWEAICQFMSVHRTEFSLAAMCRVLRVSRIGYYAWSQRRTSSRWRRTGCEESVDVRGVPRSVRHGRVMCVHSPNS